MKKHNGEEIIQTDDGPGGYGMVSTLLVGAACDFFFERRGLTRALDQSCFPQRGPRRTAQARFEERKSKMRGGRK